MDNSHHGLVSKEWLAYDAAHPELAIENDSKNESIFTDALALRGAINGMAIAAAKQQIAETGINKKVRTRDFAVSMQDGSIIPVRAYRSLDVDPEQVIPAFMFFHGGGMVIGTLDGEDFSCMTWALALGFEILNVCYRHAPENVFPTQTNDAWDAFEWALRNSSELAIDRNNFVVGGASAGGTLTSSVLVREVALAKKESRPLRIKGQLLLVPWLIQRDAFPFELFAAREKASLIQCADAPTFSHIAYDWFLSLCKVPNPREPLLNVALAADEDLRGMPPTVIIANGRDMLRDDAFLLAEKLDRLGIPTKKHIFPGLPHLFQKWADLPSTKRYHELLLESIKWLVNTDGEVVTSLSGRSDWHVEIPDQYR